MSFVEENYSVLLQQMGIVSQIQGCYLKVGDINVTQGWILHVSIVPYQAWNLFRILIPFLVREKVAFKIPGTRDNIISINNGELGMSKLGKVVSVYPKDDDIAYNIAKQIIEITSSFKGPQIVTDIHLGGLVYARYGSFEVLLGRNCYGGVDRYMYNRKGDLIPDTYSIPFKMPLDVAFPFKELSKGVYLNNHFLNNRYKIFELIKNDAKGRVFKALRLKGIKIEWCIIKEGRSNAFVDDEYRDACDRILWQYRLHSELGDDVPVPKALDYFTEKSNSYFVMQYLDGKTLKNEIEDIYSGDSWRSIDLLRRNQLLDLLVKVLHAVKKLHDRGYVHRDITHMNFIVSRRKDIYMIDLELAYSISLNEPDPPFKLGTIGFMSPEQRIRLIPSEKEDVYSVGALMIVFFTKLLPSKFSFGDSHFEEKLRFFIMDNRLVEFILECINSDANLRPPLSRVVEFLTYYQFDKNSLPASDKTVYEGLFDFKGVIESAIDSLHMPSLRHLDNVWHSYINRGDDDLTNAGSSADYQVGFFPEFLVYCF